VENVAPWLPVVALAVLVACGGGWRKAGWWLAGLGVLVFLVALGVGSIVGSPKPDCEDGLCAEYLPFFIGLFLEIALGAVAVLLAIIAVIVRAARAA
jgi:ABC-type dipeptide/oligopeptide/nickel transport system permease component